MKVLSEEKLQQMADYIKNYTQANMAILFPVSEVDEWIRSGQAAE